MKYQSITEKAAIVRKSLKEIGITSKQVSVKSAYSGYDDKLTINIKDLTVSRQAVENIARQFEEYERDERSGEILQGGNTYIFIDYDYDARRAAASEMMKQAEEIVNSKDYGIVARCGELEVVYIPDNHTIKLVKKSEITDELGTYTDRKELATHTAYNEHDTASALGLWKYQHNLVI